MLRVGDWIIIKGLSERDDFSEGEVIRIHEKSKAVDIWLKEEKIKRTINRDYLHKVRKEVSKEEKINAALDLGIKEWFMVLTDGKAND